MALQGELALREGQVEKLSAVGRQVLNTLDPLRSKCSAQLQELLVSAKPHRTFHHPAVSGLEMLPGISSSCIGYWRAFGCSAAVINVWLISAGKPCKARGGLLSVYDVSLHRLSGCTFLQTALVSPVLALYNTQRSVALVCQLCAQLDLLAASCQAMEDQARLKLAEVSTLSAGACTCCTKTVLDDHASVSRLLQHARPHEGPYWLA